MDGSNANWMGQLPKMLQSVPLNQLAIPGSHDSSTFCLDKTKEIGKSEATILRVLANNKITGCIVKDIAYNWSVTQTLNYEEQLTAGIRYFDLRTEKREKDSIYYFVHGLYGPKVFDCMYDINTFLEQHPTEVVLLDFNHFYSITNQDHATIVQKVLEIFGSKVCPRNTSNLASVTLENLWENKWQVLIFYHVDSVVASHSHLWPGSFIPSPWADTMDVKTLIADLTKHYMEKHEAFEVCQGVITPQTKTVLFNLAGSVLKKCAEVLNPVFTDWLKDKKRGSSAGSSSAPDVPGGINVCIMDFVDTDDYIARVLALNH